MITFRLNAESQCNLLEDIFKMLLKPTYLMPTTHTSIQVLTV